MWWSKRDREIEKELRFHIESQVEENLRAGMSPDEARRQASLLFGGRTQVAEECREIHPLHWLEVVGADLRHATRTLMASRVFSLAAIVSIGLGIGANTAIFALLNAALWRPLAVPQPRELYHLLRTDGAQDNWTYSWTLYEELRDAAAPYGAVFARGSTEPRRFSVGGAEQERVVGEAVSGEYFPALGITASTGRLLEPNDDKAAEPLIVFSHSFWVRRFHADPSVVGRIVQYEELPFRIIGVAQEGFRGVDAGTTTDVWVPVKVADRQIIGDGVHTQWLSLMMRAKDPGPAQAAIETRFQRHVAEEIMPGERSGSRYAQILKAQHVRLRPAHSGLATQGRRYERALFVLMGIVAIVLAIACANVANLLMARNLSRRREMAVRLALGAGRARLASQLLGESLLVALVGAAFGLGVGLHGCQLLVGLLPSSRMPLDLDLRPDKAVLGFTTLAAILTALLCGVGSVWRAWRSSANALRHDGGRVTERSWGRKLLVVGQLALSFLLVAGAGLFLKTLHSLAGADLGFQPDHLMAFDLSFPRTASKDQQRRVARDVWSRLVAREGILATFSSPGIYADGGWSTVLRMVDGKSLPEGSNAEVQLLGVGPGFFETLDVRLLAGRTLTAHDDKSARPVVVVNETFARLYFGHVSAIGHMVTRAAAKPVPADIVGVVQDVKHMGVKQAVWPVMYLPALQRDGLEGTLLVRTAMIPAQLRDLVARELRQADPSVQIEQFSTLTSTVNLMISRERLVAYLSAAFGVLATLLAVVGLYGVMSYNTSQRTNEIGVRMALGAVPGDIRRLVLRESLRMTAAGLILGFASALAAGRLVRALLHDVSPSDPGVLAASAAAMFTVALCGAWLPAARVSRVDPNTALRQD
jgi:predicted permease